MNSVAMIDVCKCRFARSIAHTLNIGLLRATFQKKHNIQSFLLAPFA